MGNVDFGRKAWGKGSDNALQVWVGNAPASPASTSPSQSRRGLSLHRTQPNPASSFFMGITSKCLLGLLGA